jgi:hypothetical protein
MTLASYSTSSKNCAIASRASGSSIIGAWPTLHRGQNGAGFTRHHRLRHIFVQQIGHRPAQHQHGAFRGEIMPFAPRIGVGHNAGKGAGNAGIVIGDDPAIISRNRRRAMAIQSAGP